MNRMLMAQQIEIKAVQAYIDGGAAADLKRAQRQVERLRKAALSHGFSEQKAAARIEHFYKHPTPIRKMVLAALKIFRLRLKIRQAAERQESVGRLLAMASQYNRMLGDLAIIDHNGLFFPRLASSAKGPTEGGKRRLAQLTARHEAIRKEWEEF